MTAFSPSARILIRDAGWLVRRIDPASDGGHLLNCDLVSDLALGRSALFLTKLEGDDQITLPDPAQTEWVADSNFYLKQHLEPKLWQSTPNDDCIHLGHLGIPGRRSSSRLKLGNQAAGTRQSSPRSAPCH